MWAERHLLLLILTTVVWRAPKHDLFVTLSHGLFYFKLSPLKSFIFVFYFRTVHATSYQAYLSLISGVNIWHLYLAFLPGVYIRRLYLAGISMWRFYLHVFVTFISGMCIWRSYLACIAGEVPGYLYHSAGEVLGYHSG